MEYRENATRAEMKEEAIIRMEALKIDKTTILNFQEDDRLIIMEGCLTGSYCFSVAEDELLKKIKEVEEKYGFLVYYVILEHWPMYGEILTMLYVGTEKDTWQREKEELLERGTDFAYVISEQRCDFADVSLEVMNGIVFRTDGHIF